MRWKRESSSLWLLRIDGEAGCGFDQPGVPFVDVLTRDHCRLEGGKWIATSVRKVN